MFDHFKVYYIKKHNENNTTDARRRRQPARDAFRLTFEFFLKYNYPDIYGKRKKDKTFLKETTLN